MTLITKNKDTKRNQESWGHVEATANQAVKGEKVAAEKLDHTRSCSAGWDRDAFCTCALRERIEIQTLRELKSALQASHAELVKALEHSRCSCLYKPVDGKRERQCIACSRCTALANAAKLEKELKHK